MANCKKCDGRGFAWHKQQIVSKTHGAVIADTYKLGDRCSLCAGTGKANRAVDYIVGGCIVAAFVAAFYGFSLIL